jgi:hypothetical protein
MDALTISNLSAHQIERLQAGFLALLPKIEQLGRVYFRHLRCRVQKDDALQEMRALAWKWFLQLARRGKDVRDFLGAFTALVARAVRCGRRVTRSDKPHDVMCWQTQQRRNFAVRSLSDDPELAGHAIHEALQDNTRSPVPDQVSFRIDFPRWRRRRSQRDRRIIDDLMVGERVLDVAKRFGLTPTRISQLRRELHADWESFTAAAEC